MILTFNDIKRILTGPADKALVKATEYSKKLRQYMYGHGLEPELITGFETPSLRALRAKYALNCKDIFSRIGRPIDKVFTARGGSFYLNVADSLDRRYRQMLSDITEGQSLRDWVKIFWRQRMLDDPGGVILIEIASDTEVAIRRQKGMPISYPTFRSSSEIRNYKLNGNRPEYLVLAMSTEDKVKNSIDPKLTTYRVIDDAYDYIVKMENPGVTILTEHTLVNYFAEVPAVLNSDIPDPVSEKPALSFFDDVLPLAEHYYLKGSVKFTHDMRHGYPKLVEVGTTCANCSGTGTKDAKACETCGGSGLQTIDNVSSKKVIAAPNSKDDAVIKPSETIAYHAPSKDYHEIATADLEDLEHKMHVTLWGAAPAIKSQGMSAGTPGAPKTATEIITDLKPQADRLPDISEMAELRIKFICDMIIRTNGLPKYQGCSFSAGRRYILESPDAVWSKYQDTRAKGAPQPVLDDMLIEYYETAYQSDGLRLSVAKKLMTVEPFVHLTVLQVKAISPDPKDFAAKLYFSEWLNSLNDAEKVAYDAAKLREMLYEYASTKALPDPVKQLPAA